VIRLVHTQYAVKAFAEALEVVPRILAENSGQTALDVISQLYAAHEKGNINVGVNIEVSGGGRSAVVSLLRSSLMMYVNGDPGWWCEGHDG